MADVATEIQGNEEELRSLLRQAIRDLTAVQHAVENGKRWTPSQLQLAAANVTSAYGRASAVAALRAVAGATDGTR